MSDRFGLQIQALASAAQKVLVVSDLVSARAESSKFQPSEIKAMFMMLEVPPPKNIPQTLANLSKRQLTLSHGKSLWSLTPRGRQYVLELVGDRAINLADLTEASTGAEFAHVLHTVIPPWAAPPRWQVGIKRFLEDHPFETNVFCMTRFPSEGPIPDPVATAIDVARTSLKKFGLTLHLASDRLLDDDMLSNIGAYMWGSQYGIGIVEDYAGSGINYNAVIELGGMIVTGRRCAILKDNAVASLPTDLSGHVYKPVNLDDPDSIKLQVEKWASSDLGLLRTS